MIILGTVSAFFLSACGGGNAPTDDVTAPTLAEVIAVPTPTSDNTPNYTFSSDEVGTITYGGSCDSVTTIAVAGDNTITFNTLAYGTYNDCTITVIDAAGNPSAALVVTAFEVVKEKEIASCSNGSITLKKGDKVIALEDNTEVKVVHKDNGTKTVCVSKGKAAYQE